MSIKLNRKEWWILENNKHCVRDAILSAASHSDFAKVELFGLTIQALLKHEDSMKNLVKANSPILGMTSLPKHSYNYFDWAKTNPSRAGFEFVDRVDFWATRSKGMDAVFFLTKEHDVVFPVWIDGNAGIATVLNMSEGGALAQYSIADIMPLFPKALQKHVQSGVPPGFDLKRYDALRSSMTRVANEFDSIREHAIKEAKASLAKQSKNPEQEALSELDEDHDDYYEQIRVTPKQETAARQREAVLMAYHNKKQNSQESKENDMSKVQTLKTGMVNTNKEALKAVGYLNAGRASNKLIKEACRPLLNAMFKPTFMQKLGMKLFNMKNPVDVALATTASDLVCAQLVQAIIELRGIENQHVREVSKAGITYAGLKLSETVPLEKFIDDVVAKLEEGADDIVAKIKK